MSYAQLGINQLGAVYEGLMAYSGFFAETDLYEIAKDGDPADGTWVLPVDEADGYPDGVFITRVDEQTGQLVRVRHPAGSFVYRLSGRDRQLSASYYTPELLTRCLVQHALAELLGLDDHAPRRGSSGITRAEDLLKLTICEPALGSGAFANEAANQLATEYVRRRQAELGDSLDPERYKLELQRVKAHFALNQTYGVDLNTTRGGTGRGESVAELYVPGSAATLVRTAPSGGATASSGAAGPPGGLPNSLVSRGGRPGRAG